MTKRPPNRGLRASLGLFVASLIVVGIVFGKAMRQDELNRALIAAVRKEDVGAVQSLLRQGADAAVHETEEAKRPFMERLSDLIFRKPRPPRVMSDEHAIDPSTLQIVLEAAYDNSHFFLGRTAADDAIGEMLVSHGADPHGGDLWIGSATKSAAEDGLYKTLACLLTHGASREEMNVALIHADPQSTTLLLRHGASPNTYAQNGRTALQEAVLRSKQSREVAGILLAAGADPNAKDNEGDTALMIIEDPEMAQLLLRYGANINAKDKDGLSVLTRQEQMPDVDSVDKHNRLLKFLKQKGAQK